MENNESLVSQLKKILTVMDERLSSVEHTVNDVIIGSLRESAEEYDDNEKFNAFHDNYGSLITDLVEPYKIMCGEDYDVERSLYDNLKEADGYGTDGFDEKSIVEAKIAEVKEKLEALQNMKKEVEDENTEEGKPTENTLPEEEEKKEDDVEVKVEEDIPSEEQLAKELAAALNN